MPVVKLSQKTTTPLFFILLLSLVIGTLAWDIVERIVSEAGYSLSLTTQPIGFDLGVLSFYIRVNPGSFLGVIGGVLIFRAV